MISKARLGFLRSLARKKVRREEGLLLVEGLRVVEEALAGAPDRVRELFLGDAASDDPRVRALAASGRPVTALDSREVEKLAETKNPFGVFALVEDPARRVAEHAWPDPALTLVADGVADPGNLGTLVRTAAALGADAVVATPGTVEPTNPKAVRATAGALFRIPVLRGDIGELDPIGFRIWVADASGEDLGTLAERPARVALVVGNEPRGVERESRARAALTVAVPQVAGVESLNVAVAAGILLYGLRALPVGREL